MTQIFFFTKLTHSLLLLDESRCGYPHKNRAKLHAKYDVPVESLRTPPNSTTVPSAASSVSSLLSTHRHTFAVHALP